MPSPDRIQIPIGRHRASQRELLMSNNNHRRAIVDWKK
jgi:hypothetical protein